MPKVYIVIVTYNSSQHLSKLFLSLHDMDYPKSDWNLIVVDNNSRDDTVKILRQWQAKMPNFTTVVENKINLGFSGGNNLGIKLALDQGADYIALLNDDTIVEPDWLSQIIKTMETNKDLGLCQPLLTRYPEVHRINNFGNAYQYCGFGYSVGEGERAENFFNKKFSAISNFQVEACQWQARPISNDFQASLLYEPSYCSFSAVVIRAQVFRQVGFMDELYFMYHEDTDFCFRARLEGWKLGALKTAVVHHNYKFPSKKNKIRYYWLEKNRLYLMLKFFKWRTLLIIFPAFMAMELGLILFSILRGFFLKRCQSHIWIWKNLKTILKNRRETQQARRFSDKKLFDYIVPIIEFQEIKNPLLDKIGNPILKWYFGIIKGKIK